jgi:hypothetical protein
MHGKINQYAEEGLDTAQEAHCDKTHAFIPA